MKHFVHTASFACCFLTFFCLLLQPSPVQGQNTSPLEKTISVTFDQQRLDKALVRISHLGNFYFSYNSDLLKADSLITLSAQGKTVRQILDLLFHGNLEYKVSGDYIILLKHVIKPESAANSAPLENRHYTVTGFVLDETSGDKVSNASVYDRNGLAATLSNEAGYFTLRLKNKAQPVTLSVSKESYEDTTLRIFPGQDQRVVIVISPMAVNRKMITITPDDYLQGDSVHNGLQESAPVSLLHRPGNPIQVEMSAWGRLLLSSRFTVQSINLRKFFMNRSFQLSFLPGIGTHWLLSPQIENKISINMLGGYSGGLQGVELGGVFNVDKKKVSGVQAAGLINVVGGTLQGVQLAGVHNTVLDSASGFQAAGVSNMVKGTFRGVQMAGVLNQAHHLKGVQIGVVNVADTSEGYSIGLFNYVKKGYREFSFFTNEVAAFNAAFRSGNDKLYTIIMAGMNPGEKRRCYTYGWGLGHRFRLSPALTLQPEITSEHLALGSWNDFSNNNFLQRLSIDLHWRLSRHFSISGGPSLAIFTQDHPEKEPQPNIVPIYDEYSTFTFSDHTNGWIGWRASINFL